MQLTQLPLILDTNYNITAEQNNILLSFFNEKNRKSRINIYVVSVSDRGPHLKSGEPHLARGPAVGSAWFNRL